jgi:hypothetical protein
LAVKKMAKKVLLKKWLAFSDVLKKLVLKNIYTNEI